MNRYGCISLAVVLVIATTVVVSPALAKRNNPNIDLEFLPQQAVAEAVAAVTEPMLQRPVHLVVRDARAGQQAESIGSRTDDDDRVHALRAVGDVGAYAQEVGEEALGSWGIRLGDDAGQTLNVGLVVFRATEENQAVGATFSAQVRLSGELTSGGRALWSGTASGDASRYGKKFSNENVNEVLSDALLEAYAELLSDPGLARAWAGKAMPSGGSSASTSPGAAAGAAVSPAELLTEVEKLMGQGFDAATMETFVSRKVLSAEFSADDLVAWKEAGVPESVLQTALELPVR